MINKYCEWCGKKVEKPYYSAMFSLNYLIFTQNENVDFVDYEKREVHLKDGQLLDFSFMLDIQNGILGNANRSNEHLLCSEQCENDYFRAQDLKKPKFTPDIYKTFLTLNFQSKVLQQFYPIALNINNIECDFCKCDVCGETYPAIGRNWKETKIIEKIKIEGKHNERPNINLDQFLLISGLSEKKPLGYYYAYKMGTNFDKLNICSYDCAFFLAQKNNSAVSVDSVLEHDRWGFIIPETEEFNKDLQNRLIHRPSFIDQI